MSIVRKESCNLSLLSKYQVINVYRFIFSFFSFPLNKRKRVRGNKPNSQEPTIKKFKEVR